MTSSPSHPGADPTARELLARAVSFALGAHGAQTRKGTPVPYVSHLLQVSGLVLEHGGDLEQAAAGVLHDVVEDTPVTLAEVEAAFGAGVAAIVGDCTDTQEDEAPGRKRPWRERKQRYVLKLRDVGERSALVIACDKLHNMRTQVSDLEHHGPGILARFNAPPPEQRWLHGELLAALHGKVPPRLFDELSGLVRRYAAGTGE
jgi:(p)ppGpp synthase/HD superfamily hydrolase